MKDFTVKIYNGANIAILAHYSDNVVSFAKIFKGDSFINSDLSQNTVEIETYVNSIYIGDG